MKPAPFAYTRATSVAHAIDLLSTTADSRPLAGGQSLGPMLNLRLARPAHLIDIKRVPEIRGIDSDSNCIRIGSCWTHAEIEDGVLDDPTQGLLPYVARGIAYRAVRNRGTIGGSLAHADPASDWVTVMALLNAGIITRSMTGTRRHDAATFVQAPFTSGLAAGELLTAIELPRLSPGTRWAYLKVCRKVGEFARAIGAAVLDPRGGLTRVICGAADGGAPVLLPRTAARLAEAGPAAAAAMVADEIAALGAVARLQVHTVAVRRALLRLAG
jgi:aerobic carbon-monoxide dehydrogenase medium subunit